MKTLKNIALAAVILTTAVAANAQYETVNGYYRNNGTYVRPHYRSSANSNPSDNLSYRGYPSQQLDYISPRENVFGGYTRPTPMPSLGGITPTRPMPYTGNYSPKPLFGNSRSSGF